MGVYTEMAVKHVADTAPFTEADSFQLALDMQRADHAMFEALIELDFGEIYQEMGIMLVTEADEAEGKKFSINALKENVLRIIGKFLEGIKTLGKTIFEKFQSIFDKDKVLYNKYKDEFAKNANNTIVPKGTMIPNVKLYSEISTDINKQLSDIYNRAVNEISNNGSIAEVNNLKDSIKEDIDKVVAKIKNPQGDSARGELVYYNLASESIKISDAVNPAEVEAAMKQGMKKEIKMAENITSAAAKHFEDLKTVVARTDKDNNMKDTNMSKAKLSALGSLSSQYGRACQMFIQFQIKGIKDIYAAYRKLWILGSQVGVHRDEKDDEKEAVNASYVEDLCTLSDLYMEEAFAF